MAQQWLNSEVKIVKLADPNREVAGTMGLVEDPQVGDVGTVIYEYPPPDLRVTVEKKDPAGNTIWFADFARDELELLSQNA